MIEAVEDYNARVEAAKKELFDAFKHITEKFQVSFQLDGDTDEPDGMWLRASDRKR